MRPGFRPLLFVWLCCYSALTWANTTFAQDIIAYDYASLFFAALAGLLGGAGRTIVTLTSPGTPVGNVRMLLLKDLVVALVGGAVVFVVIQGWNSIADRIGWFVFARDFRILLIVAAGYSRGRWFGVLDKMATNAIANVSEKVLGGATAPPVVSVPDEPPGAAGGT